MLKPGLSVILLLVFLLIALSSCTSASQTVMVTSLSPIDTIQFQPVVSPTLVFPSKTPLPSATLEATSIVITSTSERTKPTATSLSQPTLTLDEWKKLPVVPAISDFTIEIFQRGLQLGNNPRAFSKIGDCGSTPAWFLGDFDLGADFYRLGPYESLEAVIREFRGSFGRTSLAARSGFNASSLFVSLWADPNFCEANETPLACEYRIHRPVIAFIMLGTNDVWHPEEFEPQMRKIIEYSIQSGVVPILTTKADNQEKDGSINAIIAKLAVEYDIPLWNFWLAVQSLPNHGLQEDGVHLTWGRNFFDDPEAMTKAWPIRNLTALQVLDAIWLKVRGQ